MRVNSGRVKSVTRVGRVKTYSEKRSQGGKGYGGNVQISSAGEAGAD